MFLVRFGFCGVRFKRGYELGDERNSKITILELLLFQIVYIQSSSNVYKWFKSIVNDFDSKKYLPAYQDELRKARTALEEDYKEYRDKYKNSLDNELQDFRDNDTKISDLRNVIMNFKFADRNFKETAEKLLDEIEEQKASLVVEYKGEQDARDAESRSKESGI